MSKKRRKTPPKATDYLKGKGRKPRKTVTKRLRTPCTCGAGKRASTCTYCNGNTVTGKKVPLIAAHVERVTVRVAGKPRLLELVRLPNERNVTLRLFTGLLVTGRKTDVVVGFQAIRAALKKLRKRNLGQ